MDKEKRNEYMRNYYHNKKYGNNNSILNIKEKSLNINDKKEKSLNINTRTPNFKKRTTPLEETTINNYIKYISIINKLIKNKEISKELKTELVKMFKNEKYIKELILNEMDYINKDNIQKTIEIIRNKYNNNNTFKSLIGSLVVITSHIEEYNDIYQILTNMTIHINEKVEEIRSKNEISSKEEGKIIDLSNKEETIKNINKLKKIDDKLLFGLYTLLPPRRLETRQLIITTVNDVEKLNNNNYLTITKPKYLIYNNYKTYKKYGKVVIEVPLELDNLFNMYINYYGLKEDDYIFHKKQNKKDPIDEPTFSKKITRVFNKIYDNNITIRNIRQSVVSNICSYTLEERKKLAHAMSHSVLEQLAYNKKSNDI